VSYPNRLRDQGELGSKCILVNFSHKNASGSTQNCYELIILIHLILDNISIWDKIVPGQMIVLSSLCCTYWSISTIASVESAPVDII